MDFINDIRQTAAGPCWAKLDEICCPLTAKLKQEYKILNFGSTWNKNTVAKCRGGWQASSAFRSQGW